MAVVSLNEDQKADILLFLNNNIEELAVLPASWESLAIKLSKQLLDKMLIFEPSTGSVSNARNTSIPAMEVAYSLLFLI